MTVMVGKLTSIGGEPFGGEGHAVNIFSRVTRTSTAEEAVILQLIDRIDMPSVEDGGDGTFITADMDPGPIRVELEGSSRHGEGWDINLPEPDPEDPRPWSLGSLIGLQVDWDPVVVGRAESAAREATRQADAAEGHAGAAAEHREHMDTVVYDVMTNAAGMVRDEVKDDADRAETQAGVATEQAGVAAGHAERAGEDRVQTGADRRQTGEDRAQTGEDRVAAEGWASQSKDAATLAITSAAALERHVADRDPTDDDTAYKGAIWVAPSQVWIRGEGAWHPISVNEIDKNYVDTEIERIRWDRARLAVGANIDTLVPATYNAHTGALANSIVGGPTGKLPYGSAGFLTIRAGSGGGDARIVEWTTADTGATWIAARNYGTWSPWEKMTREVDLTALRWNWGAIPDGTDLNKLGEGVVTFSRGAQVATLKNLPPGISSIGYIHTIRPGGTAGMQTAVGWTTDGRRTWARETQNGQWRAWQETTPAPPAPSTPEPEAPVAPRVVFWGDSAVDGMDNVTGTWPDGEKITGKMAPHLSLPVINRGYSGQKSTDVLIHAGIFQVVGVPVGGSIPASGAVDIDTAGQDYGVDSSQNKRYNVSWAGVTGLLRRATGTTWTFTRANAGTAVPITTPTPMIATDPARQSDVNLWLMGGNDWIRTSHGPHDDVTTLSVSNYVRAVEAVIADPQRKVLIGGVKTRSDTRPGDANDVYVKEVNDLLKALFPHLFVDRQAWLTERGLNILGLTPTAEEQEQIDAGIVPARVFADETHVRREIVAAEAEELWARALRRRGWA